MLALHELETDTCPCGCGQPASVAHGDDAPDYRVETLVCRAGAALERARDHGDQEPGTLMWVVPDEMTSEDEAAERAAEAEALAALTRNTTHTQGGA